MRLSYSSNWTESLLCSQHVAAQQAALEDESGTDYELAGGGKAAAGIGGVLAFMGLARLRQNGIVSKRMGLVKSGSKVESISSSPSASPTFVKVPASMSGPSTVIDAVVNESIEVEGPYRPSTYLI